MGSMLPSSRGSAVIRGRVGSHIFVSWGLRVGQVVHSACRYTLMNGRLASSGSHRRVRRLRYQNGPRSSYNEHDSTLAARTTKLYRHLMHRL